MNIRHLALIPVLALAGCASTGGSEGVTRVELTMCENSERVCSVSWTDGKEKQRVKLEATFAGNEIKYVAEDVRAFDGQAIRAALEREISADTVGAVMQILTGQGLIVP